ncbi:MAG: phytanoyl-CoA dioxygenase family protein [Pseudomonadota bacterium]|nr:phytanoyl-CoA dioxygenase family protein [Pseudomonadota bacterium]
MNCELSVQELAEYRTNGFVVRRSVFQRRELGALRRAADIAVATAQQLSRSVAAKQYLLDCHRFVDIGHVTVQFEHHEQARQIRVIEPVHHLHKEFEALVDDKRLVMPMRQLVRSDEVGLWTAKLNVKSAQCGSSFGWHQDAPYWVHDHDQVERLPNVMLNFDDSSTDNGCLHLIRGTHKLGMLPGCNDGRQLAGFYTDPKYFDESDQVAVEVPAGSLVFFDPLIVHGSPANTSNRPRRGIILTYQPAQRPTLKKGDVRNAGC